MSEPPPYKEVDIEVAFGDSAIVEAFNNFLSWGESPRCPPGSDGPPRNVPPAWWAYALGLTNWCPPKGEM